MKSFKENTEKIAKMGEGLRKQYTDKEGVVIRTAAASMSILPKEARRNLVQAQKNLVEAGKVLVEDYLTALDNLLVAVSK